MLRATVSGSFHRHMSAVYKAVQELTELGADVLSPADPRVVAQLDDFLFVASDKYRSVKLVEDRHLESIRASDFVWLVTPDGYVGQSASMEIGYAAAIGTPVFSLSPPTDLTLQQYVRQAPSLKRVVERLTTSLKSQRRAVVDRVLVDPEVSMNRVFGALERIDSTLRRSSSKPTDEAVAAIERDRDEVASVLSADVVRTA